MANWRVSNGTDTIDLDETFNLLRDEYRTSFTEQVLEGTDGVIIDGESRRKEAANMTLSGLMQEDTPAATETKYIELKNLMDSREDNLTLEHISTGTTYDVQHSETTAERLGGGILQVTITLRKDVTIT